MVWFAITHIFSRLLDLIGAGRLAALESVSQECQIRSSARTMGFA
jgi:hypothetical protein